MDTKEEVQAIAERMAWVALPGSGYAIQRAGFEHAANVFLPHILSLMARVKHGGGCMAIQILPPSSPRECTCGLDAELKSIEELLHPTT